MFWGLIMEPQRRYTQKVKKSFHISMAALDVSTSSEEPAQVMCGFEGRNYLLCTLGKPDMLQCSLDLNFEVGDEISLAANGKCHVHLTGYLTDELNDLGEEEEEEDDEVEEKPVKTDGKTNKKRNKNQVTENGPPKKKSKVGLVEEDASDDDSDLDVKALLGKSLDDDEDDESYASEDDDDQDAEEEESDAEDSEGEDESSLTEGEDSDEEVDVGNRKARKMNGVAPKQEPASPNLQPASPNQKLSKKERKIKQQQQNEVKSPNKESQSPKKKNLQGGIIVEDLREGNGPSAKAGKFVHVYYEGRLKNNNKVFDSTNKGAGFSFRLGGGEVIKGWDIGVAGMKVGGKRRITCPPAMAYGQKGSPPTIPANSTLVFEVELRKVK